MAQPQNEVSSTYKTTPPLRLSRVEREKLNYKIYKEINRLVNDGYSAFTACNKLALESLSILGYELGQKQIRGRYLRWKKG